MNPREKSDFGTKCRLLRLAHNYRQREVAEKIGVACSTYGNMESSPYKVVGLDKAEKLAKVYGLDDATAKELFEAWERVPLSPYSNAQRQGWERKNRMRSKAKHHDRLMVSLVEVLGAFIPHLADRDICACTFGEPACEVCTALENLGLPAFTSKEKTIEQLSRIAEKLSTDDDPAVAAAR